MKSWCRLLIGAVLAVAGAAQGEEGADKGTASPTETVALPVVMPESPRQAVEPIPTPTVALPPKILPRSLKASPKLLPQRTPLGRAVVPPKVQAGSSSENVLTTSDQPENVAPDGAQPLKEQVALPPASSENLQKAESATPAATSDSVSPSHDPSPAGVETAAHSSADSAPPVVAKAATTKDIRRPTSNAPRPGGKAMLPPAKAGVASPLPAIRTDSPASVSAASDSGAGELPADAIRPPAEALQQADSGPTQQNVPSADVVPLAPASPAAAEKPLAAEVGAVASPPPEDEPRQVKEAVPPGKAAAKAKLPAKQPLRAVVKPESKVTLPPVMPDVQESAKPAEQELVQQAGDAMKEAVPAAKARESDAPPQAESEAVPAMAPVAPPEVWISPLSKIRLPAKAAGRGLAKPVEKPLAPGVGTEQASPPTGAETMQTPPAQTAPLAQELSAAPALGEKTSHIVEAESPPQPAEQAPPAQAAKAPGKAIGPKGASRSALKQPVLASPAVPELTPAISEVAPPVAPPVAPVEEPGAVATPEVPAVTPESDSPPPVLSEVPRPVGKAPAKAVGPRGLGRNVLKPPVPASPPVQELQVPMSEAVSPVATEALPAVEPDAAVSKPEVPALVPESDLPAPAMVQSPEPVAKAQPKSMGAKGQARPMAKAPAPIAAKPVPPEPVALPPESAASQVAENPIEEKPSSPPSSDEVATTAPDAPSEQPPSEESAPVVVPASVAKPASKGVKASAKPQARTAAKPSPAVEPDKVPVSTESSTVESPVEEKPSQLPSSDEVANTAPGAPSEQPPSDESAPVVVPAPVAKPATKGVKASAKPQARTAAKPQPIVEPDKAEEVPAAPGASPEEAVIAKPDGAEQIVETAPLESVPVGEKPVALPREWTLLGELYFPASASNGKISLSLEDIRRRGSYYEVWERVEFLPRKGVLGWLGDADTAKERLTLWAVRCGRGMMARILEANDGAFGPRAESLKFYVPLPESAGAAVVETVCTAMRQRAETSETAEVLENRRFKKKMKQTGLDAPPMILDAADFDEEDEPPPRR